MKVSSASRFALNLVIGAIVLTFPISRAADIATVSVEGQFSDATGAFFTNSTLPVSGSFQTLTFTNALTKSSMEVDFMAQYLSTTVEPDGSRSDLVKISYGTLFGTDFLANQAILNFDGEDASGTPLPIDAVIDYSQAGLVTAGYILNSNVFPANSASFATKAGGLLGGNGAPNSAFFELNYSYVQTPEPGSYGLAMVGLAALCCWKRRFRAPSRSRL